MTESGFVCGNDTVTLLENSRTQRETEEWKKFGRIDKIVVLDTIPIHCQWLYTVFKFLYQVQADQLFL